MSGRLPHHTEAPHDEPTTLDLSPEQALIAAMLRCAVLDARSQARSNQVDVHRREDAQRWLRNRPQVEWWLTLVGLPESTYGALLKAAGLEEG